MKRRHWLGFAGAAGVLAVGAGLMLRRAHEAANVPPPGQTALWQSSFDRLDGSRLEMASLQGRPLVVNFWATWCAPCVREMPLLQRFHDEHAAAGWQVLGIAADNEAPVREFVQRLSIRFPVALAGAAGIALSRELGNDLGGLPFTIVCDPAGTIRARKSGEVHAEDLAEWAGRLGSGPSR